MWTLHGERAVVEPRGVQCECAYGPPVAKITSETISTLHTPVAVPTATINALLKQYMITFPLSATVNGSLFCGRSGRRSRCICDRFCPSRCCCYRYHHIRMWKPIPF